MLDFTRVLYLGFQHGSRVLRPWSSLTQGVPAALREPLAAHKIANELANLVGFQAAVLAPSTLHLFWDLPAILTSRQKYSIFIESGTYPIGWWGAQQLAVRGLPVQAFPHRNVNVLEAVIAARPKGTKPVILCDGMCPSCGKVAPLASYLELIQRASGFLIVDDTQVFGLLGSFPSPAMLYGHGGGGSLGFHGIHSPRVIYIASMAKAFGVPMAFLTSSDEVVNQFRRSSKIRMHCSPPSNASINSAVHALEQNAEIGEVRRGKLLTNIALFQSLLRKAGVKVAGGMFPIQTPLLKPAVDLDRYIFGLKERGVRVLLLHNHHLDRASLTLVITAKHRREDITHAVTNMIELLSRSKSNFDLDNPVAGTWRKHQKLKQL